MTDSIHQSNLTNGVRDAQHCPPWCRGDHAELDEHAGTVLTVQPSGPIPLGESHPGYLLLALRQDPGTGPQLVLSHEDRPEEYLLPPTEARKLAEYLSALATSAEAEPTPVRDVRATITRPSWLPERCPAWCEKDGDHSDSDHDNHHHFGRSRELIFTPVDNRHAARHEQPRVARACRFQHDREGSPRVDGTLDGIQFTLEEAERLARTLLELVATARTE